MMPMMNDISDEQTPEQEEQFMRGLGNSLLKPQIENQDPASVIPQSLEEAIKVIQAQQEYIAQLEGMMQNQQAEAMPVPQAATTVTPSGQN